MPEIGSIIILTTVMASIGASLPVLRELFILLWSKLTRKTDSRLNFTQKQLNEQTKKLSQPQQEKLLINWRSIIR